MPRFARSILFSLAAGLAFGACQSGQSPSQPQTRAPKLFDGLGKIHHPISSQSKDAQRRPCHLEAEVFDLMTKWIERYRQQAQARYERLDDVLAEMRGDGRTDDIREQGAAS